MISKEIFLDALQKNDMDAFRRTYNSLIQNGKPSSWAEDAVRKFERMGIEYNELQRYSIEELEKIARETNDELKKSVYMGIVKQK